MCGCDVRRRPGISNRGREPLWIVLLRVDPRCLPAGHDSRRAGHRRVRRPDRGNGSGGDGDHCGALGVLLVAQRHRRSYRRGSRHVAQHGPESGPALRNFMIWIVCYPFDTAMAAMTRR